MQPKINKQAPRRGTRSITVARPIFKRSPKPPGPEPDYLIPLPATTQTQFQRASVLEHKKWLQISPTANNVVKQIFTTL